MTIAESNPPFQFGLLRLLVFLIPVAACNGSPSRADPEDWKPPSEASELHPVVLTQPPNVGALKTNVLELSGSPESGGAPVGIDCSTCHGTGSVPAFADHQTMPRNFHALIVLSHGNLECGSCHILKQPSQLHSSAGEAFPLSESMQLCSQCHGPIRTAYDHGAHGGMRGYWDLQRGPRERNDCISCHSPHAPAYPKVMPVAGPKDRRVFKKTHTGSILEMRFGGESHE